MLARHEVWKLDRLARSVPQPLETVTGLEGCNIGFHTPTESLDMTTPPG